jgi:hypothetical protein
MELARDPEPLEREHHRCPEIGERVVRCRREVALLLADGVTEPRLAGVPMTLGGVDGVVRGVDPGRERDLVEDEELALGAEVGRVGDAGAEEMLFGASRDAPRVAVVRLAADRVGDLADERERRLGGKGVEDRRSRVRDEEHVALRDPLPTADGGAVEAEALVERGDVERAQRHRHVLPLPEQVAELEVDHLRLRLARPRERLVGLRLRPVRQVVLVADLLHPAPPSRRPLTSESPGVARTPRLRRLPRAAVDAHRKR